MKEKDVFEYLDNLRDSGITNMFGAVPYLQTDLGLSRNEASRVLREWMETFDERHPEEV